MICQKVIKGLTRRDTNRSPKMGPEERWEWPIPSNIIEECGSCERVCVQTFPITTNKTSSTFFLPSF